MKPRRVSSRVAQCMTREIAMEEANSIARRAHRRMTVYCAKYGNSYIWEVGLTREELK